MAEPRGTTRLADRALRRIARQAALSVPGSVEHTSGLTRLTGRAYPLVEITAQGSVVSGEVHIAAQWPVPLAGLAGAVRETVREVLLAHTGAASVVVDVHVGAVVPGPTALPDVSVPLEAPGASEAEMPAAATTAGRPTIRSVAAPDRFPVRGVSAPAPMVPRTPTVGVRR